MAKRSRRSNLAPDPKRYQNLPPEQNPYAPADVGPLSEAGRAKNRGQEDPNDPLIQQIRAKPRGEQTARELGKLGSIAGSKIGGQVSRALMELGKQRLQEQQHQDIDTRIAHGEAEHEPAEKPKRPDPMF